MVASSHKQTAAVIYIETLNSTTISVIVPLALHVKPLYVCIYTI